MEKEYYYALEDNAYLRDDCLPVFHEVSTEDVKHLALYIVNNFKPLPAATPMEGYISAITHYSLENKEFPYCDVFDKLKYGFDSGFLFTNVALALYEKHFSEDGITEDFVSIYNNWQAKYKKQLNYSQQLYNSVYDKDKVK